jgi:hypothetical protein
MSQGVFVVGGLEPVPLLVSFLFVLRLSIRYRSHPEEVFSKCILRVHEFRRFPGAIEISSTRECLECVPRRMDKHVVFPQRHIPELQLSNATKQQI